MPFQPLVRIILSVDPEQDDETDAQGRPYLVLTADLSVGEHVPGVYPEHVRDALMRICDSLHYRLAEMWELPLVVREPLPDPIVGAFSSDTSAEFAEQFRDALVEFLEGLPKNGRSAPVSDTDSARNAGPVS